MGITKQLYQLQEIDLEIESNEQALSQKVSQVGERQALDDTQSQLTSEQQRLEELKHQQHDAEWEVDDILSKIANAEEKLYSGKINNPKELTNLQQEINSLKAKRNKLEDQTLEIMERVELVTKSVTALDVELKRLEIEWQNQQQKLSTDLQRLKAVIADLKNKRELLATEIDSQLVEVYNELKKQRGTAVAKVEQGICQGCRISLPITELQRARRGSLVRCSSCGRILFLA